MTGCDRLYMELFAVLICIEWKWMVNFMKVTLHKFLEYYTVSTLSFNQKNYTRLYIWFSAKASKCTLRCQDHVMVLLFILEGGTQSQMTIDNVTLGFNISIKKIFIKNRCYKINSKMWDSIFIFKLWPYGCFNFSIFQCACIIFVLWNSLLSSSWTCVAMICFIDTIGNTGASTHAYLYF